MSLLNSQRKNLTGSIPSTIKWKEKKGAKKRIFCWSTSPCTQTCTAQVLGLQVLGEAGQQALRTREDLLLNYILPHGWTNARLLGRPDWSLRKEIQKPFPSSPKAFHHCCQDTAMIHNPSTPHPQHPHGRCPCPDSKQAGYFSELFNWCEESYFWGGGARLGMDRSPGMYKK